MDLDKYSPIMWGLCIAYICLTSCMAEKAPDSLEVLGEEVLKKDKGLDIEIKPVDKVK